MAKILMAGCRFIFWPQSAALASCLMLCCLLALPVAAEPLIKIAVISDLNGRYGTVGYHERVRAAVRHIIDRAPDLVICTGDMVAGQQPHPLLSRGHLSDMWDAFDQQVRQPLRQAGIPLAMTPGNHDASAYSQFSRERTLYRERQLAHPPPQTLLKHHDYPFRYAFEMDGVVFLSLDATRPGALDPDQRRWIEETLADHGSHRPRVLFGHLPLQAFGRGRERDVLDDGLLEEIIAAPGTIYLSGHHHAYYPGWRDNITMLSVGNLGGNPRRLVGSGQRNGFGYAWLEIDSDGHFQVDHWQAPAYDTALDQTHLPAELGVGQWRLQRLDLVEGLPVIPSEAGRVSSESDSAH